MTSWRCTLGARSGTGSSRWPERPREWPTGRSSFWDYNRDCHAVTQVVGVRRLTDLSKGVISLAKLISQMKTAAKARRFTREAFLAQWDLNDPLLIERAEQGGACSQEAASISITGSRTRTSRHFRAASEQVKDHVDQYIAHRVEQPKQTELPTFADLHRTIDDVGEMFKKYSQVLKAAHWATLVPSQGDWRAIFRQPWVDV